MRATGLDRGREPVGAGGPRDCRLLAAIAAIVWELGPVKTMAGWLKTGHLALVGATVLSSWTFLQAMFALHYAGVYFGASNGGMRGGLDFPADPQPDWMEFFYQAFVIGCTFATSDVNVTSTRMRRIVVIQGVVCFFFNTIVLALDDQRRREPLLRRDFAGMSGDDRNPDVPRPAPAARTRRPRRRRPRRGRSDDGEDRRGLRALRLRGGRDAVHRIYRRARQVSARSGSAERGRVLVQGRRRAMAVAALRPDRAARPLCRRELRPAAEALSLLSRGLGVPQREAGAGALPPVHAVRRRHGRLGVRRRRTPRSA